VRLFEFLSDFGKDLFLFLRDGIAGSVEALLALNKGLGPFLVDQVLQVGIKPLQVFLMKLFSWFDALSLPTQRFVGFDLIFNHVQQFFVAY
jgi:hypothetical protein